MNDGLVTPDYKPSAVSQINSSPKSKLKKQVINRLINVKLSPLNKKKKAIFLKLVNNDSDCLAIIGLGFNMDSTIGETKDML